MKPIAVIAAVMLALGSLPTVAPPEPTKPELCEVEYIGEFICTAYCGCRKCNGKWYGYPTASGTDYVEGRTLAVDPDVIPLGTELYIEGYGWYVAEDTGDTGNPETGIYGYKIDMYYDDHDVASKHGVKRVEVWVKEGAI